MEDILQKNTMSTTPFIEPVGSFPQDQILGMGRTGLANIKSLRHEQDIYRRLGKCDGVVPCIDYYENATHLGFMKNGDLRIYLSQNWPSKALQLAWFRDMARTLACIHDRVVIVVDIASHNFLFDSDLSIKFCNFTESTKFPLGTCMETAEDDGYSVQTDIEQIGAVIYEVVTGKKCEFDLFKDVSLEVSSATWPRRDDLPEIQDIWLGEIIEKCWTKGAFRSARDLLSDLESVCVEDESIQSDAKCQNLNPLRNSAPAMYKVLEYVTSPLSVTFAMTITAVICLTTWKLRRSLGV